jgi:hypothetical protein
VEHLATTSDMSTQVQDVATEAQQGCEAVDSPLQSRHLRPLSGNIESTKKPKNTYKTRKNMTRASFWSITPPWFLQDLAA